MGTWRIGHPTPNKEWHSDVEWHSQLIIERDSDEHFLDHPQRQSGETAEETAGHDFEHVLSEVKDSFRQAQIDFKRIKGTSPEAHGERSIKWRDVILFLYEPEQIRTLFEQHTNQWLSDTFFSSSMSAMAVHPSYQRIIGMGRQVIPLILADLRKEPKPWFWALTAITGENPAASEDTMSGAAKAWLDWGKEQGFVD